MNRVGIREVCDIVFKPLTSVDLGGQHFDAGQPMLYIDSAKTSSLEQAVTTVYAQGGKGNPRLVAWDGEKQLTFTFEDSLLSPTSFAMLSGAGLVKGKEKGNGTEVPIYTHATYDMVVEEKQINSQKKLVCALTPEDRNGAKLVITREAPVYPVVLDSAGAQSNFLSAITETEIYLESGLAAGTNVQEALKTSHGVLDSEETIYFELGPMEKELDKERVKLGDTVRIDCYEVHHNEAYEMSIEASNFAGYYYIEASTLFRDEATGQDLPAEFIIPRGKIQSNFTFTMANSGDPSTFTFTVDCMPAFTKFNRKKKVMAVLQIIDSTDTTHNYKDKGVLGHEDRKSDSETEKWYSQSVFNTDAQA